MDKVKVSDEPAASVVVADVMVPAWLPPVTVAVVPDTAAVPVEKPFTWEPEKSTAVVADNVMVVPAERDAVDVAVTETVPVFSTVNVVADAVTIAVPSYWLRYTAPSAPLALDPGEISTEPPL